MVKEIIKMNETKKSMVTVKNVIRILSVLCTIIVFCPTFLVSCSGETMDVSVMTAVGGLKAYGESVAKPHPFMIVCLLIPVAILVMMFIKKIADNTAALATAICGGADFIIWIIFRNAVKKAAEENYCQFESTAWFALNMISLVIIILLSVLVVLKVVQMEDDLVKKFTGAGAKNTLNQMSAAVSQVSGSVSQLAGNITANANKNRIPQENIIGYCSKCGSPLLFGDKFCTSCGTPIPESMIAEAEAARKAAEEEARKAAEEQARLAAQSQAMMKPAFCSKCGAKLTEGSNFCEACGTKVN